MSDFISVDQPEKLFPPLPKRITVLDLGSRWLKLVTVTRAGRVKKVTALPAPEWSVVNGVPQNSLALKSALQILKKKHKLRDPRIVLAINDLDLEIRTASLPEASISVLDQSAAWLLEEQLLISPDGVALDSLPGVTSDGNVSVTAVYCGVGSLSSYMEIAESIGLVPVRAIPAITALTFLDAKLSSRKAAEKKPSDVSETGTSTSRADRRKGKRAKGRKNSAGSELWSPLNEQPGGNVETGAADSAETPASLVVPWVDGASQSSTVNVAPSPLGIPPTIAAGGLSAPEGNLPLPDSSEELVFSVHVSATGTSMVAHYGNQISYSRVSLANGIETLADRTNPQALSEFISRLSTDINATVSHIRNTSKKPIKGMHLSGFAPGITNLKERVEAELGIPVLSSLELLVKPAKNAEDQERIDISIPVLCALASSAAKQRKAMAKKVLYK